MNQIKLTDRQSKRLIKMCMNLFVSDIKPHIDNNNNIVVWNLAKDVNAEYATSIHWFEFCMTHLANELYNNIDYTDSSEFNINLYVDLMLDMVNFKINPIDFLYKEFLKTKTNNK